MIYIDPWRTANFPLFLYICSNVSYVSDALILKVEYQPGYVHLNRLSPSLTFSLCECLQRNIYV